MDKPVDTSHEGISGLGLEDGWVLLPLAAAVGGAWAFAQPWGDADVSSLLIMAALMLGGWHSFWRSVTRTDWATPLSRWRDWDAEAPLRRWPYLQPGTPGAALHRQLRRARAWWRSVGREALILPLRRALLAGVLSLLLSAVLGRLALLLTFGFIAVTELATLWHEGRGCVGAGWRGLALGALPWLLGASLGDQGIEAAASSSFALLLLIGFYDSTGWQAVFGPLAAAGFLVLQGRAIAPGWILLLAVPGGIVLARGADAERYHQVVGPWLLAMIGVMAWAVS
jgi:hypothetical protein